MKYASFVLLLFVCLFSSAQTDTSLIIKNVKAGMDSVQHSFKQGDWNTFTDLMHPDLIKLTGGRQKFIKLLETQMGSLNNASFDSLGTGNLLQLINYKGQWQCIVESFLQMSIELKTVTVISGNIGVSYDNGSTWKFMRVSTGKEEMMVKLFPSLSPNLKPPLNKTFMGTVDEALKDYKPAYPVTN